MLYMFLTQAQLFLCFYKKIIEYKSQKVLAITNFLEDNVTIWFKPTMCEYLKKGVAYSYTLLVKAIFNNYDKFKRKLKEAFRNLDEARDQEYQLV